LPQHIIVAHYFFTTPHGWVPTRKLLDALIYGVISGLVFTWLWP
jgi:hypothetical protein